MKVEKHYIEKYKKRQKIKNQTIRNMMLKKENAMQKQKKMTFYIYENIK